MKFIENKKSSQPSTETEASPPAPNGDVENKPIIPQKTEKSTEKTKKVDRKSLADKNSSAVEGDERAQEAREGSQKDEKKENITKDVTSQYGNNPTYAFLRDASMHSIPQNPEKSTRAAKKCSLWMKINRHGATILTLTSF